MDIIIIALGITAFCGLIYLSVRYALSELAKHDKFFTTLKEGQVKYVVRGGELKKTLLKVKDHSVDQTTGDVWLVDEKEGLAQNAMNRKVAILSDHPELWPEKETLLEKLFMVRWVGFFGLEIFQWDFVYDRLGRSDDPRNDEEGYEWDKVDKQIIHRASRTSYLSWQDVFPIGVKVLTADLQQLLIKGSFTIEVGNTYFPIFTQKGKWFPNIRGPVESALLGYFGLLTRKEIQELNILTFGVTNRTHTKDGRDIHSLKDFIYDTCNPGLKTTGIKVILFTLRSSVFGSKNELEAAESVALAKYAADAKIAKAEGDARSVVIAAEAEKKRLELEGKGLANAIKAEGTAKAGVRTKLVESTIEISEDQARIIQMDSFADGLSNSSAQFLSLGGNTSPSPLIDLSSQKKPTETAEEGSAKPRKKVKSKTLSSDKPPKEPEDPSAPPPPAT